MTKIFTGYGTYPFKRISVEIKLGLLLLFLWPSVIFGQTTTQTINTTGAGSFVVPAGVTHITVEVWGGGGGGGNSANSTTNGGGGGGGGAYSRKVFSGALPASYNYFVGAGGAGAPGSSTTAAGPGQDSWFDSNTSLMAQGGTQGNNNINGSGSRGTGGLASAGFGDIKFNGGDGANATDNVGAAGGGSAGTASDGTDASGTDQTAAVTDGGTGGNGGTSGNPAGPGGTPGGGGGGSNDIAAEAGGNGGNGQIRITYVRPTATIARLTPASATTNQSTVTFLVTFSETVTGVSVTDFVKAGTATATLNAVNAVSGTQYEVEFTGVGGNGNLNLDFDSPSIVNASGNSFSIATGITSEEEYTIDTQGPVPTNVTSPDANGSFVLGQSIDITIQFNDIVTVTGTPQLTLETGAVDRIVNYVSGSGTNTILFTYTVASGDVTADLDYIAASPLALNGGSITDAVGNNASLVLPAAGGAGSLGANKALVVDGVQPTVTNVTSDKANGTYTTGEVIDIDVVFSHTVNVTGTPQITLETGTTDRVVNYSSGSGSNTLTFNYTVQLGDVSSDLDYIGTNALQLNGGVIERANGNDAILTLATPGAANSLGANKALVLDAQPFVTQVSASTANGAYNVPDVIDVTVTFSENVIVTGFPQIELELGATDRMATYLSGSTTNVLTFRYIVQPGDNSLDLDYTGTGALSLNGGTIVDGAALAAVLTLPTPGAAGSLGANKNIVIDTTPPAAPSAPDLLTADDTGFDNDDNIINLTSGITLTGTSEPNASIEVFEGASSKGTTTADGSGNWTLDITLTAGTHNTFTAVATDAAGNVGVASTALASIIVDTTPPTTGAMSFNLNPGGNGNPETITWTFSENVTNINNGSGTTLGNFTMTGFSRSPGSYDGIATQAYNHAAPRRGTLTANTNNSNWDANIQISYSAGNIYDVAGNPMAAIVNQTPGDIEPPVLITGLIFNPDGAGNDIITFQVSETLNLTDNTAVAGFTVSTGSILSAIYSGKGTTNTITLTANGNVWNQDVTVIYDNGTGTARDVANNHITFPSSFPGEPILIKSVSPFGIYSNNANSSQYSTTGNTITVQFTTSRVPTSTPTVNFPGIGAAVSVTGAGTVPNPYIATSPVIPGSLAEGAIPFSITVVETGKSTTTTFTTDGSSVVHDKTAPTISPVTISSNNANSSARAKVGDVVTLSFTVSEALAATPTVTIAGRSATVGNAGLDYTATLTLDGSETEGTLPFNISVADATAGNAASATATTNASSITYDKTVPTVDDIVLPDANPNNTNSVDFTVTFTESVTGVDAGDFSATGTAAGGTSIGVSGSGDTYTVTVSNITATGTIGLSLNDNNSIEDVADNRLGGPAAGDGNFSSASSYTMILPEPPNHVTNFQVTTATSNSITLTWTDATGSPAPTGYLVTVSRSGSPAPAPADFGTPIANQTDLVNNTTGYLNVNPGVQTATFSNLASGASYIFEIYPYTNSGANIDFKIDGSIPTDTEVTPTATLSSIVLNSTPVTISSLMDGNPSTEKAAVMQFTIYDDGQNPISPNVMTLHPNFVAQESITFNLADELTLANGASLTGFSVSSGAIATAVYSGKGTTNTITLTSTGDGQWNSSTTVSYSATTGNAEFVSLGKMQSIENHSVVAVTDFVDQIFDTPGTYIVPAGVTKIVVEAWGAGGGGGALITANGNGGGGGAGGNYVRSLLTVTPGASLNVLVGTGGTGAANSTTCCPDGQQGGSSSFGGTMVVATGGYGGVASDSRAGGSVNTFGNIGDVVFLGGAGGQGGAGVGATGGGGGSSGGYQSAGNQGTSNPCFGCSAPGGSAPVLGGAGGAGVISANGGNGFLPGGGGGGTGGNSIGFSAGNGANGRVRIVRSNASAAAGPDDWSADNSPLKFNQLVISQGAGNSAALANWQNIIAGAELFDGTNTISDGVGGVSVQINPDNITFLNIPSSNPTDVGFVPDANGSASSKTYTLRIWLRDDLSNTLAATVDGLNLAFRLNPASGITYNDVSNSNQQSSRLVTPHPVLESGAKEIQVEASQLVYRTPGVPPATPTDVPPSIGVGIALSNVSGQDIEVYALDANNNLDLDYNGSATITTAPAYGQSTGTLPFSSGKLSLDPFFFTTGTTSLVNTTQITVAGPVTPATNNAVSSPIAPLISSLTTITAGPTVETGSVISSMATQLTGAVAPQQNALQNFDFIISDDVGANTTTFSNNDNLPTRFTHLTIAQGTGNDAALADWTDVIAMAELKSGAFTAAGTIGASTITFGPLLNAGINDLGYVADGGSKTYTLRIALRSNVTDPDIIDAKDFVFEITTAGITLSATPSASSFIQTAQAVNSGDGNNLIQVTATQLDFINQWASGANQNYDAALAPTPTAKARDANGNLDIGYNTPVTVATAAPATYPLASNTVNVLNGLISFDANLRVTSAGNGTNGATTSLVLSDGSLTGNSNTFTLNYSNTSDIVRDGTFSRTSNILAINNQEASDLTAANSIAIDRFILRDGGASNDGDGTPTRLSQITLNISNHTLIRRIGLYDETNTEIKELTNTSFAANGDITFGAFDNPFEAADDDRTTKLLTVRVSFASALTDNEQINVRVLGALSQPVSSQLIPVISIGPATLAGDENRIEVVASRIDFINPPTPPGSTTASLNSNFAVTVHARDALGNLDLDFTAGASTITALTNVSGATMSSTPAVVGSNFTNGVFTFPANFQFTSGNNNDDVTLTIEAGGISSSPLGITPLITLTSSFESVLVVDPLFTPVLDIPYISNQDISTQGTSFELTRFRLNDGDGTTPDLDGAPTNIDDLTLSITNPGNVRALGIYLGSTLIQSRTNAQFVAGSPTTVTFENLSASLVAPDDGNIVFTIRASFFDTPAQITDNEEIQVRVVNVTQSGGSQFNNLVANPIGGVTDGAVSASNVQIEVLATRLDFTTQPEAFEGINQPLATPPVVEARDANGVVDLDQNNLGTLTSSAGLSTTSLPFVNGVMAMTGLQYISPGIGTLTVASTNSVGNAIASNAGGSTACSPVDVIHVTANLIPAGTGGVLGTPNIKGGSIGAVILGFTFQADYVTVSEPTLNGFSITFDNPYKSGGSDVLKNFKVFESTNGTFAGSTDIAALTGSIVQAESGVFLPGNFDQLNITFATPRTLYQAGVPRSYFLVADVDVTANISTPAMTARLIDRGFGHPTNNHILTSKGSATAEVIGQTYSFASTRPPQLVSSSPANGQLNVDPALGQIDLFFDVDVLTFDGVAQLYDRKYNKLIATLPALNGVFNGDINDLASQTVTPLSFDIPAGVVLKPDSLYYLRIAPGSYDPVSGTGTGISDEGQNFYGGISYNGTLYFKISSPNPPNMVSTDANKYFVSNSAAVFNASFDQFGKGFYLVIDKALAGTYTAPTNAEIANPNVLNPAYVTHGTFDIQQLSPNLQSVAFSADLNPGGTYDVWIYAQNDAQPTPIAVSAPYGKVSPHTPGSAGPTITLNVPAVITSNSNRPIIQVCPNSKAIVTDAIVIGESAPGEFNGGAQNFNLLLPTGFQFDLNDLPNVVLSGTDFSSAPTVSFVNATILNIAFTNLGTASLDNIIISDFTILASEPGAISSITRFAGSGLGSVPDGTVLATLFAKPVTVQEFTNTYTTGNDFSGVGLGGRIINVIPDNFNLPSAEVRLLPSIVPETDYGPSFFSGPGVTNDILNLTGVALNTAFDISMTHTDLNGCISTTTEQYLVYDHQAAIPIIGTEACITNINFPSGDSPHLDSPILNFNAKAGYFLVELFANIPASATAQSQIMFGPDWQNLVSQIPYVVSTNGDYKNYKWDYSVILNAVTESGGAISVNPYNNNVFADTTINNRPYWRGGSLGVVEFTGRYRNTADLSVEVPFRQEVELFVPPIPVIEVSQSSAMAGSTPIFCETGSGDVIINGFPLATAGVSTGFFVLRDSATNAVIYNATTPVAGFRDNSNGTANLAPATLAATLNALEANRGYRTLLVEYTFQENNSPCSGTGRAYLRIAPNPVAAFSFASEITENTPLGTEACEGIRVNFDGSSSSIAQGTIAEYRWNFGDATGSSGSNPNDATGTTASHTYNTSAVYLPTLTARSTFGCTSAPADATLNVGSIPVVDFTFEGVSTADAISFESESVLNSASAVNDNFARLRWTYGNGNSQNVDANFTNPVTNIYATAGIYTVNLRVTSVIGCTDDIDKTIIVVPRVTPTGAAAYNEGFESNDGGWQTSGLGSSASTWAAGEPSKTTIQVNQTTGRRIWTTNLNGSYGPSERSALYSPSFDLRQLDRPMISFNHFVSLAGGEGVVVEFSTDNKNLADATKTWKVLGKVGSGVAWYDANGLSSQPGGSGNTSGLGWTGIGTDWKESKNILDTIPSIEKERVVFRFAVATQTSNPSLGGFAIDNIRIGNRTRTVLVENFRNLGGNVSVESTESANLRTFKNGAVGTRLVKLNYHVGFPERDPFNLDNPQDPSSRALYYNIKSTPIVRMDGDGEPGLFSTWGSRYYDEQTLKLSNALLTPNVDVATDGSINVDVTVQAVGRTLPANATILHVALVEKLVPRNNLPQAMRDLVRTNEDDFEYVLKKMLPSARGTRLTQTLTADENRDSDPIVMSDFSWTPDESRIYSDSLAVVVFLQDETTKEVYQAEIHKFLYRPAQITGLEPGLTISDVTLYPNPADEEVTIVLPRAAVADVNVQLYDQAGRALQQTSIPKGDREKTLNVKDLPASLYLIKLEENGVVTLKRAMVVHRN
ncbi:MAG: PKD domain-containing protein [Bacteroidota bacterium]